MKAIGVENILDEFKAKRFFFNNELIFNYFNCLITKPFLILTGISGSGKSTCCVATPALKRILCIVLFRCVFRMHKEKDPGDGVLRIR